MNRAACDTLRRVSRDRDMPKLSVVIPAYNEAARIGPTLDAVERWLESTGEDYEVIVVDDGSADETARMVEAVGQKNPRIGVLRLEKNRGKGAAVRAGVLATRGEEVLFSDADLATPIE